MRIKKWIENDIDTALLDLSKLNLTELPYLPSNLKVLYCSGNKITSFHNLPQSLNILYCDINPISCLEHLPNHLEYLNCSFTKMRSLINLPPTLQTIVYNYTNIDYIDTLPNNLKEFVGHHSIVKYHICDLACNCKKFKKFYKTKINREKYEDWYKKILSHIIHEPLLAKNIIEYMGIPYINHD